MCIGREKSEAGNIQQLTTQIFVWISNILVDRISKLNMVNVNGHHLNVANQMASYSIELGAIEKDVLHIFILSSKMDWNDI